VDGDAPEIRRSTQEQRFEVVREPAGATLEYRRAGDTLRLVSAEVPECQFVSDWLDRHPERAEELEIVAS
jgi:hypothetical protein